MVKALMLIELYWNYVYAVEFGEKNPDEFGQMHHVTWTPIIITQIIASSHCAIPYCGTRTQSLSLITQVNLHHVRRPVPLLKPELFVTMGCLCMRMKLTTLLHCSVFVMQPNLQFWKAQVLPGQNQFTDKARLTQSCHTLFICTEHYNMHTVPTADVIWHGLAAGALLTPFY